MKKKITVVCLIACLLMIALVGGTIAYFTDAIEVKNVFTVGNVEIALHEDNGLEGEDYKNDDAYRTWLKEQKMIPGEPIEKNVWIENTGTSKAYVRVKVLIPEHMEPVWDAVNNTDGGDPEKENDVLWEMSSGTKTTVDGVEYTVYIAAYQKVLEPETRTEDCLTAIQLSSKVRGSEDVPNTTVIINAEAIQATGFENAAEAFKAFEEQEAEAENTAELIE